MASGLARAIGTTVVAVGLVLTATPAATAAAASPAAPSALTVTPVGASSALTWVDGSTDETGFSVERCVGVGCTAYGQVATVGANMTSYTDTYAVSGSATYRVRAFNGGGYSPYSNSAGASFISAGDVSASVTATPAAGPAPLTVTFDGSASTALNGTVTSWEWSFGDNQIASGAVVTHTYAAAGVYAASLKVRSSGVFPGSASTAVVLSVTVPPLSAPNDLSATSPARQQIRLTWTNPVSSGTSLGLERCAGSGCTSFVRIAALPTTATSYLDVRLKKGDTYTYRLAVANATGTVYSNRAAARVRR